MFDNVMWVYMWHVPFRVVIHNTSHTPTILLSSDVMKIASSSNIVQLGQQRNGAKANRKGWGSMKVELFC